jgi:DNA-binding Xre family transcriptional regulator
LFTAGTQLAINNSMYVMTVESVENGTDNEGKNKLTLKGRSLEATVLDNRVAMQSFSTPNWELYDKPKTVMETIFNHICRDLALDPGDAIPFLQPGSIMPASTLDDPIDPITYNLTPKSLYEVLNEIGGLYGLGFRLLRNFDQSQLYFDVYAGSDRTTGQNVLPPVVFAPELDNLQNTTELTTIDKAKNVAYVYSDQGSLMVYAANVDPDVAGFERNVMTVQADSLEGTPTDEQLTSHLMQVGREALFGQQTYSAFDGETNQYSEYKYGTHYNLGDMVEIRNADGMTNKMRVTEQIFVNDTQGERAYPTLSIFQFINTGSWLSWKNNQVWADLENDPTTWADQA